MNCAPGRRTHGAQGSNSSQSRQRAGAPRLRSRVCGFGTGATRTRLPTRQGRSVQDARSEFAACPTVPLPDRPLTTPTHRKRRRQTDKSNPISGAFPASIENRPARVERRAPPPKAVGLPAAPPSLRARFCDARVRPLSDVPASECANCLRFNYRIASVSIPQRGGVLVAAALCTLFSAAAIVL